jgi:hypothetical protein
MSKWKINTEPDFNLARSHTVTLYDAGKQEALVGQLIGVVDWNRKWLTFRVKVLGNPRQIVTLDVPFKWCILPFHLRIIHAFTFMWLDTSPPS